jgi:hypothetical protein
LAQDASEYWARYVEAVVTGNGHTQVSFNWVTQLCVAAGLVVYVETSSQSRPQNQAWLDERKYRTHLGAQSDSQFRSMRSFLVGYFFSRLAQAIEVTADSVARHFDGFFLGASIRNEAGKQRNSYLVSR